MKVAFWSPVHGQTTTTGNAVAVSTMLALEFELTTLITRTHYEEASPERCFINKKFSADFSDITGLDAIMRYIKYNPITGNEFKNYVTSLIKQKLDLLEGTKVSDKNIYNSEASDMLQYLLKKANDYYNMCIIDVSAGYSPLSQNVIKNMADLVVVNLNQNVNVLDDFFNSKTVTNSKIFYIISMYNNTSRVHLNNIMRRYKIKRNDISIIPYCRAYADFYGEGSAIAFILRNLNSKKDMDNFAFINSLKHTTELIVNKLMPDCKKVIHTDKIGISHISDSELPAHITGIDRQPNDELLASATGAGCSPTDELLANARDMHIDGVSGGMSGITTNVQTEMNFKKLLEDDSVLPYSFDSVWIFFNGTKTSFTASPNAVLQ